MNSITGSKCVDKSPTCRNSAFQAFACPDKELQKSCMKSCGLCRKIYIDNRLHKVYNKEKVIIKNMNRKTLTDIIQD